MTIGDPLCIPHRMRKMQSCISNRYFGSVSVGKDAEVEGTNAGGDGEIQGTYCVWLPSTASHFLIKLSSIYIVELKFETISRR